MLFIGKIKIDRKYPRQIAQEILPRSTQESGKTNATESVATKNPAFFGSTPSPQAYWEYAFLTNFQPLQSNSLELSSLFPNFLIFP